MDSSINKKREKLIPPINVDISNDYTAVDRGLFSIVVGNSLHYARVATAKYKTYGPTLAPGYIAFTLQVYDQFPMTEDDYAAGIITPDVYDSYSTGSRSAPILIEYWCKTSYINVFANNPLIGELDPEVVAGIIDVGNSYTGVILGPDDPRTISVEINYESSSTAPLEMIDYTITVHVPDQDDVTHVVPLTEVTPLFDPVLYIRNL